MGVQNRYGLQIIHQIKECHSELAGGAFGSRFLCFFNQWQELGPD